MIGRILYWLGLAPQRQEWALFYDYAGDGISGGGWIHTTITVYRNTPTIDIVRTFQGAVDEHLAKTQPGVRSALTGIKRLK